MRHFSRFLRSGLPNSLQFGTPLFHHHWTVPAVTAPRVLVSLLFAMRHNLKRYYGAGDLHFITCSCYRRQPLFGTARRRDLLLTVLEQMRKRYQFVVAGYVIMPEHIHLLISEPQKKNPSTVPLLERREKWRTPSYFVSMF